MKLNVRPVLDRIILKPSEGREEIAGLKIPDSEKEKPLKGVVVAHGEGWTAPETGHFTPISVKLGDEVMYMDHSASEIEIDGVDYIYIKERDLICIL
jgi:chaperonin GroES